MDAKGASAPTNNGCAGTHRFERVLSSCPNSKKGMWKVREATMRARRTRNVFPANSRRVVKRQRSSPPVALLCGCVSVGCRIYVWSSVLWKEGKLVLEARGSVGSFENEGRIRVLGVRHAVGGFGMPRLPAGMTSDQFTLLWRGIFVPALIGSWCAWACFVGHRFQSPNWSALS